MEALGIDIGGSALKAAPVDTRTGRLSRERRCVYTPRLLTPRRMAVAVAGLVEHFNWKGPIGIGFPGVVQGPRILTSDNLHGSFVGSDGRKVLAGVAGGPVALINDAAAAALAEMRFGAARNFAGKGLLLTLGTGVGSALFCRGVLFPCEFGSLPMHGDIAERHVAASVRAAEGLSWAEWGRRLGGFIRAVESLCWPDLIVIGGGISAQWRRFFGHVRCRARLVPARFRNDAGTIGAAIWAADQAALGGTQAPEAGTRPRHRRPGAS